MAVSTAEYAGWVKELDRYEAMDSDDGDGDDPRVEDSSRTARSVVGKGSGAGTARRLSKPPARGATSVAEELEQEMKLLNWHKLANEAALKAAIIKTNKIKHEDARVASSLAREDADDKRLRVQQIIEEEQLKPLEVNSEFFRAFEAREQRDDDKVDSDVQRHIQHLRRLKETMAQREDMHLRRRRFKEGLQDLGGSLKSQSVPKGRHAPSSNQEDDAAPRRQRRIASLAHKDSSATQEVLCSLDKLMELEKRIRHLEDAGLGVDGLEQHGDSGAAANALALAGDDLESDSGNNNGVNALRSTKNLRFAKRKSSGGFHEPAKTVYAVKTAARPRPRNGSSSHSSLMQGTATSAARKRSLASTSGTSSSNSRANATAKKPTFLTALPESKQRQLRRMTDRERRQFLKKEKASERQEQARHQDVVIQDWMQKKRQAAQQRKTANANANAQAQHTRGGRPAVPAPAPPRVKAPLRGAAAGRHAANPHQQKFEDLRKGFDQRRESLRNAPTTAVAQRTNKVLELRTAVNDMRHKKPRQAKADGAGANTRRSHHPPQQQHQHQQHGTPAVASTAATTTKLPAIARAGVGAPPPSQLGGKAHFSSSGPHTTTQIKSTATAASSVRLPRLAAAPTMSNAKAFMAMPSPPPASAKNPAMPQFSRLHKR